jgi:hypothetical protein
LKLISKNYEVDSVDGEEAICAIVPDIRFNRTYKGFLDEWKLMEDIDYIRCFIDLERYANKIREELIGEENRKIN